MRTNPAIVIPSATRSTRWRSLSHAEGGTKNSHPATYGRAFAPTCRSRTLRRAIRQSCDRPLSTTRRYTTPKQLEHNPARNEDTAGPILQGQRSAACFEYGIPRQPASLHGRRPFAFILSAVNRHGCPRTGSIDRGPPRHTFATTFRAGAARLHSSTLALLRGAGRQTAGQPSFFPYPRRCHHAGGILQNTCSAANSTSISCHTGQGLTCQPGTAISAVIPSMLGPPNALFRLDRRPRNLQHPAQHLCGTSPLL